MVIAIHHREYSFSTRWIEFCKKRGLHFVLVNLFDSDIIAELRRQNVTHVLFHFGTGDYKTDLILKGLSFLLEQEGIKVFPSHSEYWHYDDKLKQKYLFEQLNLPHARMHAFYSKKEALEWIHSKASFPFVFKLRSGFGSHNVKLIQNKHQAFRYLNRMFGKGFRSTPAVYKGISPMLKRRKHKKDWKAFFYRLPSLVEKWLNTSNFLPREKGYFLAQDFVEGLDCDYRLKVIGNKCTGLIRFVRKNDFRASGSGKSDLDHSKIPLDMIDLAFKLSRQLNMISVAFDFVVQNSMPILLEVSYCYPVYHEEQIKGYWTSDLVYHDEYFNAEEFIIAALTAQK